MFYESLHYVLPPAKCVPTCKFCIEHSARPPAHADPFLVLRGKFKNCFGHFFRIAWLDYETAVMGFDEPGNFAVLCGNSDDRSSCRCDAVDFTRNNQSFELWT